MATNQITSLTTLAKVGRQVHKGVLKGFAKRSETWKLWNQLKDFDLNASQRSVTATIDIVENGSGAFIEEFGAEANAKTAAPQDLTFTWANYNDRYTFSKTSEYLDKKFRDGQLVRQAKYQTMKMIEGLTKRVGMAFYGVSTGVICETSTNTTSAGPTDYALKNGFSQSSIDDTTYLASLFSAGDYVALVRSAALVTNAIGLVNSVAVATGINVTWAGSVDADDADSIVFANQKTAATSQTLALATEYNKAPFGLTEMATATSLHGLSGSTYPKWTSYGDTSGGDLTGTRLKKWQHAIKNKIGGDADLLIMAQGVSRRLYQTTSSAVHFNDPLGMEILGSVKTGSIKQHDMDPLCPPGWAFLMDKSFFYKWSLVDIPSEDVSAIDSMDNANIDKLQDVNGSVVSFDLPFQNITKGRGALAYGTGLTEA